MRGTLAVTDYEWYQLLSARPDLTEINFWKPSAARAFRAEKYSPFLFKLRAPRNAICGFAYFERYTTLPAWLAWDWFGQANGCVTLEAMRARIEGIRERMRYKGRVDDARVGCVLVVQPVFFPPELWVPQPRDWPRTMQAAMGYDFSRGEGLRVWEDCFAAAELLREQKEAGVPGLLSLADGPARYGEPILVHPRLGQGTFRVAVSEAYHWGCAATGEHSVPALEAAHIRPYAEDGPHDVRNGLLLRADFHRLFDLGYMTVTKAMKIEVSKRLKEDYQNGHTYYPYHGREIALPEDTSLKPGAEFLEWHNSQRYRA
jgi:putative restriction endonuclease